MRRFWRWEQRGGRGFPKTLKAEELESNCYKGAAAPAHTPHHFSVEPSSSLHISPLHLVDEDHLEEVWAVAIIAKTCLSAKPSRRPLARYMLRALESPLRQGSS